MAEPRIRVRNAEGKTGTIPASQLDAAMKQGFQPLDDAKPIEASAPSEVTATLSNRPQAEPEPIPDTGPMPGILGGLGAGVKALGETAERIGVPVGQALQAGKGRVAKAIGGSAGATLGATLGATVGHPFAGASAGADIGRTIAKKTIIPAQKALGRALAVATESGFSPSIYKGIGLPLETIRGVGQFGLKRLIPGVGNALLAADVGNAAYKYGKPLVDKAGATDVFGKLMALLTRGDTDQYDETVAAMREAEKHR